MSNTITKTEAIRQAMIDVDMFRQGRQWINTSWSDQHNAMWHDHPCDYHLALHHRTEGRVMRALELLGIDPLDTRWDESGSLQQRVNQAIDAVEECRATRQEYADRQRERDAAKSEVAS